MNFDLKGILGAVTADGALVSDWTTTPLSIGRAALHLGKKTLFTRRRQSVLRGGGREGGGDGDRRGKREEEAVFFEGGKNATKFQPGMPAFFHGQFVNRLDRQVRRLTGVKGKHNKYYQRKHQQEQ